MPDDHRDPDTRAEGAPHGIVDVVGVMRWPEPRNSFTPADDPRKNIWYLRDSNSIATFKKWATAAPFYIDQEAPVPSGSLPKPGKFTCPTTTFNMRSPGSASRWPLRVSTSLGSHAVFSGGMSVSCERAL